MASAPAAHDLLLELAGTVLGAGATLRHDDTGRPWVDHDGSSWWASVSHGRGVVAVALSTAGPVGVDIEARRPFAVDGLAQRWFDPAELAWLDAQPDRLEAFLLLWTAKEAVGKALGKGLREAGLRRLMPVGADPRPEGPVAGVPGLVVRHPDVAVDAVLALAGHDDALRRMDRSRTSLPVVVRGN